MPIEFLCTECPKKLRVPDDSAGKKVKCPGCGHVQRIPTPEVAPEEPPLPPPEPVTTRPLAAEEPNPFAENTANPYQSPSASASTSSDYRAPTGGGMTEQTAKVLLTVPVAIILVAQAVNLLLSVLLTGFAIFMLVSPPNPADAADQAVVWISLASACGIGSILSIAAIGFLITVLFRKSYTMAWVGVLLGMIPCGAISNCPTLLLAILGFTAGIWAIVLLCLPEGKAQFR
ncbi:zinc ribbon domain-containing protein [Blastopirellula retiformator]|uniref:Zinc finger/thioredoxin putative domain-containing protein n=1 Tax=Blastopirellula retiformator TaxID=2527970 RepID=A0A5C5VKQ4_9BACT|nr:hypothetical protein [Blastopirellula retiformator]TWT38547.1 hypothetical protein Enr8_02400 [Blastopirellula retiformator]